MLRLLLALCAVISVVTALAETPQQTFDRLVKLEGTWKGKAGNTDSTIIYRTTGGGSTLVETLFPGSPHEMVTMYHMDGPNLVLTHYCASKNQPTMKLIPGKDPKVMKFDFVSGSNMKPTDGHMHSLKLTEVDANHYKAEWTFFANGKAANTVSFDMKRA